METNKSAKTMTGRQGVMGTLYRGHVIWQLRADLFVVFMSAEVSFGVETLAEAQAKVDGWVEGRREASRPASMRDVLRERRLLDWIALPVE